MTSEDSEKVKSWLRAQVSGWVNLPIFSYRSMGAFGGNAYTGSTAEITLYDPKYQKVVSWSLRDVFPAEWKGPDFDASGGKIAIETLVLVHGGFL
jgi:phage tail-like protein